MPHFIGSLSGQTLDILLAIKMFSRHSSTPQSEHVPGTSWHANRSSRRVGTDSCCLALRILEIENISGAKYNHKTASCTYVLGSSSRRGRSSRGSTSTRSYRKVGNNCEQVQRRRRPRAVALLHLRIGDSEILSQWSRDSIIQLRFRDVTAPLSVIDGVRGG